MHSWSDDLRARLAALRLAPEREAEITEELSQHLDDRYQELRASGASDADARRLALDEISADGGLTLRMSVLAQARTPTPIPPGQPDRKLLSGVWQDLRYASRMIRRQPGFAAIIIGTLAVGIAVNSLVFTIVNGATLRPLPFDQPNQLVRLKVTNTDPRIRVNNLSYLEVLDWQRAQRTFEHIAVSDERMVDVSDDQQAPIRAQATIVSWNLTVLLRVPPALGRGFTVDDDRPTAARAAIISDDLWRTRYAADLGVLGKTIRIDGVPTTVVGIMPPRFGFPDRAQLWVPLAALPEEERVSRGARTLDAVGRLRRGVSVEQGQSELAGIAATLAERYPDSNRNVVPRLEPAGIARGFMPILIALLGAVGCVLLIACANVANLLLARAADRARDVTLRLGGHERRRGSSAVFVGAISAPQAAGASSSNCSPKASCLRSPGESRDSSCRMSDCTFYSPTSNPTRCRRRGCNSLSIASSSRTSRHCVLAARSSVESSPRGRRRGQTSSRH